MANLAVFGPGILFVTRTDVANQPPINIGYAQEFSLDESAQVVENYGQFNAPLDAVKGEFKYTGKVKAARWSGIAINAVFHGESLIAGGLQMVSGELATLPAATTTTASAAAAAGQAVISVASVAGLIQGQVVTGVGIASGSTIAAIGANSITLSQNLSAGGVANAAVLTFGPTYQVANNATFNSDLSAYYNFGTSAGLAMLNLGSGGVVSAGFYYVASGVYFFHPTDAGKQIGFNYAYTVTTGQTKTVYAHPMGYTPTFQIDYATKYNGLQVYMRVFRCISTKLARKFDLKSFSNPEIDFSLAMDPSQRIYSEFYPEVS